jgi:hypothetical protein
VTAGAPSLLLLLSLSEGPALTVHPDMSTSALPVLSSSNQSVVVAMTDHEAGVSLVVSFAAETRTSLMTIGPAAAAPAASTVGTSMDSSKLCCRQIHRIM